jgi:hypothetical protein
MPENKKIEEKEEKREKFYRNSFFGRKCILNA